MAQLFEKLRNGTYLTNLFQYLSKAKHQLISFGSEYESASQIREILKEKHRIKRRKNFENNIIIEHPTTQ